jgi:hypothetical protein
MPHSMKNAVERDNVAQYGDAVYGGSSAPHKLQDAVLVEMSLCVWLVSRSKDEGRCEPSPQKPMKAVRLPSHLTGGGFGRRAPQLLGRMSTAKNVGRLRQRHLIDGCNVQEAPLGTLRVAAVNIQRQSLRWGAFVN